tara:strand:+ start:88 stop:378 length:291 start_codon:yes stop_codon:yes gene_type:complete
MHTNLDIEIIDFLDLIDVTLSYSFIEKWRHKFSEKFVKHFQMKILDAMNKGKPIKLEMLNNYLVKKCKYSQEQVSSFFISIDIEVYRPFIYGKLRS